MRLRLSAVRPGSCCTPTRGGRRHASRRPNNGKLTRRRRPRSLSLGPRRRRNGDRFRLFCGLGLGSAPSGQKRERIEVPLRLRGQPHAEVHVRRRVLRFPARADRTDDVVLGDRGPDAHGDRAQVNERDREALGGADRQRQAGSRNGSGKADDTCLRCPHVRARGRADVDSPVLAARIRVVVEREAPKHRSFDRPAPGLRRWRCDERGHHRQHRCEPSVARSENHAARMVSGWSAVVKSGYREPR
jgi:hypothetical protein